VRLIEAIAVSDVLSIFFLQVQRSLILDFRVNPASDPLVVLEQMVETPHERLASFERLRPSLEVPDSLTLAPWPGRVEKFRSAGVLDAILTRCDLTGHSRLSDSALDCYGQLIQLERQCLRDLVLGVGMRTLWQREPDASP
jgi:hypothetical protein